MIMENVEFGLILIAYADHLARYLQTALVSVKDVMPAVGGDRRLGTKLRYLRCSANGENGSAGYPTKSP